MNIHVAASLVFVGALAVDQLPKDNLLSAETLKAARVAGEVYDLSHANGGAAQTALAESVAACVADVPDPAMRGRVAGILTPIFTQSVIVANAPQGTAALALTSVRDSLKLELYNKRVAQGETPLDQDLRALRRALGQQNLRFEHVTACVFDGALSYLKPELRGTLG
jgi:hypothetical protein